MKKVKRKIFSKKNFPLVILIILSIFLLLFARYIANPQDTRNEAAGSARLYFLPSTSLSLPIQKNVNDTLQLDLMLDPANSVASFVKFELVYDPARFSINSANSVQINSLVFPVVFEGPILDNGKVTASVSIGSDPTKAVNSPTKVATITFTTISESGSPVQISIGSSSQVLSIGSDQSATENALGSTESAFIQIGSLTGTVFPTSTSIPNVTNNPTPTKTPGTDELIGCKIKIDTSQNVFDIFPVGTNLWIATTNGIVRINTNGNQIGSEMSGNGVESPSAFTQVGSEIWVLNRFNKKISRFNVTGNTIGNPITLSDSRIPQNVRLVGILNIGNSIWVADEDNGRIYRINQQGGLIADPITHSLLDAPAAMTKVGSEVWVMNSDFHNRINLVPDILRFSESGNFLGSISNTGRSGEELPTDLMVAGNNIWYLVNDGQDARVIHFNTNGTAKGELSIIENIQPRRFTFLNDYIYILEHTSTVNNLRIYNVDRSAYICQPTVSINPTGIDGTPADVRTTLDMKLLFHGLGNAGDSKSKDNEFSNKNPIHQERMLNIQIVNEENEIVATKLAPAFYNSDTGQFDSHVIINDPIPDGDYIVKVKTDQYLRKLMPGFLTIKTGEKNVMKPTELVTGDINGDNALNILDYNILYDCGYGAFDPLPMENKESLYNSRRCISHTDRDGSDLNDNGVVAASDYNLFIRELSVGFGN